MQCICKYCYTNTAAAQQYSECKSKHSTANYICINTVNTVQQNITYTSKYKVNLLFVKYKIQICTGTKRVQNKTNSSKWSRINGQVPVIFQIKGQVRSAFPAQKKNRTTRHTTHKNHTGSQQEFDDLPEEDSCTAQGSSVISNYPQESIASSSQGCTKKFV